MNYDKCEPGLRLSNDVKENPGPGYINEIVDHTYTVHADFHQGDQLMFSSNAGKQCVAMSLCSIVYNEIKSVNIWDTSIMSQILLYQIQIGCSCFIYYI
jgi:hypothetical protein